MTTMLRELHDRLAAAEADAGNTDFNRPDATGPYSLDAAEAYMNGLRDAIGIVERYEVDADPAVAEGSVPVEPPWRTDIEIIGIPGVPTLPKNARVNGINVRTTGISVNGSRTEPVIVTLELIPSRLEFIEPARTNDMTDTQETTTDGHQ